MFVTFRPEFAAPWIGRPHVTALTINRLAPAEVMALIDRVASDKPLAANIRQDIVERADGIPLFVEEMTKAVLEAGDEAGGARGRGHSVSGAGGPRELARLADGAARPSGIGQGRGADRRRNRAGIFLCVARPVARLPEAELLNALDRLLQSGLLSRQGAPPDASYLFKHALVQDAAYGTLLREPRRALHERIAEALEDNFLDIVENRPEILARHCAEAGQIEKAALLWGKAGQRSLARSALVEAEAQLSRALAQIAALPSSTALRREQIKLHAGTRPRSHAHKGLCGDRPKRRWRKRERRSTAQRRSGTPLKTRWFCFLYCGASGPAISRRSTATPCAGWRRSFLRSPRSKPRRRRSCSVIASWAFPCCSQATSPKEDGIRIAR